MDLTPGFNITRGKSSPAKSWFSVGGVGIGATGAVKDSAIRQDKLDKANTPIGHSTKHIRYL